MRKLRFVSFALMVALMATIVAAPATSTASTNNPVKNIPVTGQVTNRAGKTIGTFTGNLDLTNFSAQGDTLYANGTLSGQLVNRGGHAMKTISDKAVSVPVQSINGTSLTGSQTAAVQPVAASCQILDLTLGPLHLDLLGLVVDLNQVHLTITAEQGPGNLLGNLLCAVANLLNGGGALSGLLGQIADLLNQIIGILNGL